MASFVKDHRIEASDLQDNHSLYLGTAPYNPLIWIK